MVRGIRPAGESGNCGGGTLGGGRKGCLFRASRSRRDQGLLRQEGASRAPGNGAVVFIRGAEAVEYIHLGSLPQFPRPRLASADHQPDYLLARRAADLFGDPWRHSVAQRLVETNHLYRNRPGADVAHDVCRLSYAARTGADFVYAVGAGLDRNRGSRQCGISRAALDSPVRGQFSDLGICQIGDNIVSGAISFGAQKRRGKRSGLIEIRGVGRDSGGAGLLPAGSGHGDYLRVSSGGRDSVGWSTMAVCGGNRAGLRAGVAGGLVLDQGLSTGAVSDISRSISRPARRRLSGDPIQDRDWSRRNLGSGPDERHANTTPVSPGGTQRSDFLRVRGGAWIRGRGGRSRTIFFAVDADRAERANGAGSRRDVHLYGSGCAAFMPPAGERGNGGGRNAAYRDSVAADECGRVYYDVGICDAGAGE